MNHTYIQKMYQLAPASKYLVWYSNICLRAQARVDMSLSKSNQRIQARETLGAIEGHHIVPRCFDKSPENVLDPMNIALLTPREHILCHIILTKVFRNTPYRKKAAFMLTAFLRATSAQKSRDLSTHQRQQLMTELSNARRGVATRPVGYKVTETTKKKQSESRLAIIKAGFISPKFPSHKGKIYVTDNISELRVQPEAVPPGFRKGRLIHTCPVCGVQCDRNNMARHHRHSSQQNEIQVD